MDCVLVACLRKVQQWTYVSVLAEFRHLVWPHRLFDLEQLVEHFDQSRVNVVGSAPDYLLTHTSLQKEESSSSAIASDNKLQHQSSEQERVDRLLDALFFSSRNQLLSAGVEFDPNCRSVIGVQPSCVLLI